MARKRMIDPDFWSDEKLGTVTRDERFLFMGLISNADDEGRGRANSKLIKSTMFPYDEDLTSKDIETMLFNLAKLKIVILYTVDNQEFYFLPNFLKHQNINRPSPSKLPAPTGDGVQCKFTDDSLNTQGELIPKRKEKKESKGHSVNCHSQNDVNSFFESIWKEYPNKKGKAQVSNTKKQVLYKIGYEHLKRAIDRYIQAKDRDPWRAYQNGSTFFNSGYVDYLDENYHDRAAPTEPNPAYQKAREALNGKSAL